MMQTHLLQTIDAPPKRKRAIPTKHKDNTQLAAIHSGSPDVNVIDYDRLADAILRKQKENQQSTTQHINHDITPVNDEVPVQTSVPTSNVSSGQAHGTQAPPSVGTGSNSVANQVSISNVPSSSAAQTLSPDTSVPTLLNTLFGGESATVNEPQPLNFSNHIPLGATVSDKIKQKIWGDVYFDIKLLLPNQQEENFSVSIERGAINFQQGKFNKFPISLNQWTSAFIIFTAIYIQRKPLEAPHLLKYLYMIREMASTTRSDSWRYYDEEFRKLRQSSPLPWQEPLTELVLRSNLQVTSTPGRFRQANQSFQANQPFQSFQARSRPNQGSTAKGPKFCYGYNQGQQCKYSPCQFRHACQYCKEDHPRHRCPKLTSYNSITEGKQPSSKPAVTNKTKTSKEVA
ncbi:hypothetical protein FSP39_019479 [Pinctada imbricata]|uniref:C3H1-type domain-containing protein n=1 Tax=Pinctada imbricata TaxID=66713 RepID=A0AA88XT49_PINIB|nr:hypothetical protein FSP39_019479 [Pinctada imbricata]